MTKRKTDRKDRVSVYQDVGGEWRWRRKAPNGEIVAVSSESYTRRHDAEIAARSVNGGTVEYVDA